MQKKKLFWALFDQIWTKMNFRRKRALSAFKYSNYLPLCQKSENANEQFLRKMSNCWTDRQTTVVLQGPPQDRGPIIKTTLSFPEFIVTHQKPVYSINSFVGYNQFQSPTNRVGTTIYDPIHLSIFQSTFNFSEFVSTRKKSGFFIILLQRYLS